MDVPTLIGRKHHHDDDDDDADDAGDDGEVNKAGRVMGWSDQVANRSLSVSANPRPVVNIHNQHNLRRSMRRL
ncbi:hypothetical protein PoB_002343300 [Plakobranchus ocellatus]|uniref:Uncharacterized protein n=1 Tax=Plakobranchus ocellatus TaxID=259542 RepID=A0AAV3ZQU4_9GAST|nr:hypothetical protein PoB_002343300 [Plakobranchus ocellatus]